MGWLVAMVRLAAMEMMSLGTIRTNWRSGFLGQYGAVWSSCKQKRHLAMAQVLPVKASLYSHGSVMDQFRSFLARASLRNWRS